MSAATVTDRIASFPAVIVIDAAQLSLSTDGPAYAFIVPGVAGYTPIEGFENSNFAEVEGFVTGHFKCRRATDAERQAAICGSMFGWHVPGADPARHA